MRGFTLLLFVGLIGAGLAFAQDEAPCAEVAELKSTLAQKQQELGQLQQQISQCEALKADLSAAGGKAAKAQEELTAAQSKLKTLESELSSTKGKLQKAESQLAKAESDLSAAQRSAKSANEQGSTCQRTLNKVESQLSEHSSRLQELKALEDALLPLWLSRRVDTTVAFASNQWQQLQQSDVAAQVVAKVGPYWEQALTASQPAREAAAVYLAKGQEALSQLPVSDTIAAAKVQVSNIERELVVVVQNIITTQPSLSSLNDPVALQLIVYTIMGLPMLLLFVLIASIYGGPGKSGADSAAKTKKGSVAAAAAQGKKGAAAAKGKAGAPQTPAGKKGKAVRDGADVLYTP